MQWCPPLNMATVDKGGPQIIIDRSLALDLYGPLITLRMAQECDTWVPSSVWRALDDSLISMMPMMMAEGEAPIAQERTDIERAALIWERARMLTGDRRLYWLSDSREDAHLPDWVTPESFTRFETLHEALHGSGKEGEDDAAVDALVLAAAFQERAAAILCRADGDAPAVVTEATDRGISVSEMPDAAAEQVRDQWFSPLLMRAGLFEWSRTIETPLAFVRLIAPDLLFLETEGFDTEDRNASALSGWPRSAALIWGRL